MYPLGYITHLCIKLLSKTPQWSRTHSNQRTVLPSQWQGRQLKSLTSRTIKVFDIMNFNFLGATIIEKEKAFSFLGINGTINLEVCDNGRDEFPSLVTVKSNIGNGSLDLVLKGNESQEKVVKGITIMVQISEWHCTPERLSFHVKATAKYGFLSITIFDETLSGQRHNDLVFTKDLERSLANASAS